LKVSKLGGGGFREVFLRGGFLLGWTGDDGSG
jgi:hypothetical protein